jgi:hypothetical protein
MTSLLREATSARQGNPAISHFYCPECRDKVDDLYYSPDADEDICAQCIVRLSK